MSTEQKIYIKAQVKNEGGKITVIASDATVDRHGDSIPIESWDLKNFLSNPVMLIDHDYSVEKIVGAWSNPRVDEGQLVVDGVFHDITALAREAKAMVDQGFLRDVSVGFIPHYETKKAEDGTESTVAFNELLEVSLVAIGANPAAKIKGLMEAVDKDVEKTKDSVEEFVKTFIVLETKEVEDKGAVADELSTEEMYEQKYQNLDQVFDIVYAMCSVYMDEATPVEDFSTLLTESIGLLQAVASGDGTEPVEPVEGEEPVQEGVIAKSVKAKTASGREQLAELFAKAVQTKEGKVLSKKNRELISKSVESLKGSATVLQELLEATDAPSEDGTKQVPDVAVEQKETDADVVVIERSVLGHLLGTLRVSDKNAEVSIRLINGYLNPKK